jgi:uncharacterized protein
MKPASHEGGLVTDPATTGPSRQPSASVRDRLQSALRAALKSRDAAAVAAYRSALAEIGNAEALPAPATTARRGSQHVAGSVAGLGAAEASRRVLSETEMTAIVTAQITERRAAAGRYEQTGHADRATRLRRESDALAAVVSAFPG